MSSQNRLYFLLLPLLLAGCGFQPLYGKANSEKLMAGVSIETVKGRLGQQFKADLEDRLNPEGVVPPRPAYKLVATLISSATPIGAARDGTVSRYNVYLDSEYKLYRTSDGQKVTFGKVRHVSSYNNVTNAYFSTYVSEHDAMTRGITELAEIYRHRLAAFLAKDESVAQAVIP